MEMRTRLLLACATLAALAHAQERCDTAQLGNETEVAYGLEEQRVAPNTFTLEISERDICSDSAPTGLKVTACDTDKAPRVILMDTTRGVVAREGNLQTAAFVYITVFCASDSDETSKESFDEFSELSSFPTRFGQQVLQSSSPSSLSGKSSPATPQPTWYESTSAAPSQLSSTLSLDSLLQLNVEPDSIPSTPSKSFQLEHNSEDSLPSVQMESRFGDSLSTLGELKSLSSRFKDQMEQLKRPLVSMPEDVSSLWKPLILPSKEELKRPLPANSELLLTSWQKNDPLSLDKSKQLFTHLPRINNPYSSFLNVLSSTASKDGSLLPSSSPTDVSLPSLAKRLTELQPEYTTPLSNRSPAWMKLPTRRPSATWIKQRILPEWPTPNTLLPTRSIRRSLEDSDEWWSPLEDDALSLNWAGERVSPYPWWIDNQPVSHRKKPSSWRPRYRQTQNEEPSLVNNRLMPFAAKHLKKRFKHVPPIHEEDTEILAGMVDPALKNQPSSQVQWSKRPLLPKLLLLLQEQDHLMSSIPPTLSDVKCETAHSVEDGEPWWPNDAFEHTDDAIPWLPDYQSEYSADDRPSSAYASGYNDEGATWHTKGRAQFLIRPNNEETSSPRPEWINGPHHPGSPHIFESEHSHSGCPKCPPVIMDDHNYLRPPASSRYTKDSYPPTVRPLHEHNVLGPDPFDNYVLPTERPMLSSTVRQPYPWVKKSNSQTVLKKKSISPVMKTSASEPHLPAEPWGFLSRLLLSHPTLRDSTHVIRI